MNWPRLFVKGLFAGFCTVFYVPCALLWLLSEAAQPAWFAVKTQFTDFILED